jgi:ribonuclease HII
MAATQNLVVGVDEVGRGCWAGPLVAGAVILRQPIDGITDSKKLSRRQREAFDRLIREQAAMFGIGWVDSREIEALGMTESVRLAFTRALAAITCSYSHLIIDGNINYFPDDTRSQAIIRADATVAAVSAASIIAKVARDQYMLEVSRTFPGYGFEKHVGYGTALHMQALRQYGVCSLHRRSFKPIKKLLAET